MKLDLISLNEQATELIDNSKEKKRFLIPGFVVKRKS